MLEFAAHHWIPLAIVGLVSLLAGRILWVRATDARFGVRRSGGRGGTITISFPAYTASTEFEVGATVDLIVYAAHLKGTDGQSLMKQQQAEVVARLLAWAKARRLTLDLPGFLPPYVQPAA